MSKRYFILSLCLSFLLAFALPGYAQNTQTVTGTVVDETGEPVIGATVMVVGTTTGTVTDIDGKFNLEVPQADTTKLNFPSISVAVPMVVHLIITVTPGSGIPSSSVTVPFTLIPATFFSSSCCSA